MAICRLSFGRYKSKKESIMRKLLSNKYFLLGSKIIIGLIFVISGIIKISNPFEFVESVNNFKMLPPELVNLFVIIIPWVEFSAGLLLVFNIYPKESATIISGLLVIFTIAIVVALLKSLTFNCGCLGNIFPQEIGALKILENLVLLGLSINILFNSSGNSFEK